LYFFADAGAGAAGGFAAAGGGGAAAAGGAGKTSAQAVTGFHSLSESLWLPVAKS